MLCTMWSRLGLIALLGSSLLLAVGCGSEALGVEQQNGQCASSPSLLKGTAPADAACVDETSCAPACCACGGTSTKGFSAAGCVSGKCLTAALACSTADRSTACP